MVKCPNCGQQTSGDYCQYCNFPILRRRRVRHVKSRKQSKKEADLVTKEKARREAEEPKKAKEAEKQAKKQAELAAKEKAEREAEEAKKAKEAEKQAKKTIEKDLIQITGICEELKAGKIGTKEAIQRLLDISERIPE